MSTSWCCLVRVYLMQNVIWDISIVIKWSFTIVSINIRLQCIDSPNLPKNYTTTHQLIVLWVEMYCSLSMDIVLAISIIYYTCCQATCDQLVFISRPAHLNLLQAFYFLLGFLSILSSLFETEMPTCVQWPTGHMTFSQFCSE